MAANAIPQISAEQKDFLWREGYLHVPNVVAPNLTAAALRAINARISKGLTVEDLAARDKGVLYPDLTRQKVISDLFNMSNAPHVAKQLLGGYHAVHGGQIAAVFPGFSCSDTTSFDPNPWWQRGWHIDGLASFEKRGEVGNFTCLFGVLLADVPVEMMGNLMVFPGSHRLLERHFMQHGLDDIKSRGEKALPKDLPFREPRLITGRAGDIIICNYELAHSVAPNITPNIRYVIYFRLNALDHKPGFRAESMLNVWMDWHGMDETVAIKNSLPDPPPSAEELAAIEVAQTSKQADSLHDADEKAAAGVLYARLATLRPRDWTYAFRAAACFTYTQGLSPDVISKGEQFARIAIALYPSFPIGYSVLAHNIWRQQAGRENEIVLIFEDLLIIPRAEKKEGQDENWLRQAMTDLIRIGSDALTKLGRAREINNFRDRMVAKFPEVAGQLGTLDRQAEAQELWRQGEAVMKAEPKNWAEGRRIFGRLVELHPEAFWAQLQAAASYTYDLTLRGPELQRGEAFARAAITIDPSQHLGYSLLAANLSRQGRLDEMLSTLEIILSLRLTEHVELLFVALQQAKRATARTAEQQRFNQVLQAFQVTFPALAPRFKQVAEGPECVIQ